VPTFKRSNVYPSILPFANLQFSTFNFQPTAFVPQTTNQEKTAITSNYGRKQAFMINQNGPKIFDPRKKFLKFFLLKNHPRLPSIIIDEQSSRLLKQLLSPPTGKILSPVSRPPSIPNVQTFRRENVQTVVRSNLQFSIFNLQPNAPPEP
jgi:hypothetical protein